MSLASYRAAPPRVSVVVADRGSISVDHQKGSQFFSDFLSSLTVNGPAQVEWLNFMGNRVVCSAIHLTTYSVAANSSGCRWNDLTFSKLLNK
jgi:hypothetical protein